MLLDFFATFFSSATALPIFAQDVLRVGAQGYAAGCTAPSAGALLAGALMVPFTSRIQQETRRSSGPSPECGWPRWCSACPGPSG